MLEAFITKTRDKEAASKFLKKTLKRYGKPDAIVTDGLASYRTAMKALGNEDKQQTQRYLNNQAETSHQRFRRPTYLLKFASTHASASNHFYLQRLLSSRSTFKADRDRALQEWRTLITP